MKSFYLLTLAAAVALAACSNDDSTPDPNPSPADTGLVIEQTEYTLDALDNRSATLTFSASADWTLTVTGEDADWLTVTPASGTAGSQTVELAARRNFGEAERIVRNGKHSLLSPEHIMLRGLKNGSNITSRSRLFAGQRKEANHPFPKPTSGTKPVKMEGPGRLALPKSD